jgi:hypothetical protein
MPELRRLAYEMGSPLLGPDVDPTGWKILQPANATGTLFATRAVNVTTTVRSATCYKFLITADHAIYLVAFYSESCTQSFQPVLYRF